MAQVINAVYKNASFLVFFNYDADNNIVSQPIESIPLNQLSHDLLRNATGTGSVLYVSKNNNIVLTIEEVDNIQTETHIIELDGSTYIENGSLLTLAELASFFLLP